MSTLSMKKNKLEYLLNLINKTYLVCVYKTMTLAYMYT